MRYVDEVNVLEVVVWKLKRFAALPVIPGRYLPSNLEPTLRRNLPSGHCTIHERTTT
jgi:hypothetical protein